MKEIYQTEGIFAFYKGIVPNIMLVLNPIINFVVYEFLLKLARLRDPSKGSDSKVVLAATTFSKALATIVTYPLLTIRVQV